MDDLSADLRPIVDAARAPRLTRSEKSRLWQRLERAVDEAPTSGKRTGRQFVGPWLVAAALPLAGFLGFVVGAQRAEPVAGAQPAQNAPAQPATNLVQAPAPGGAADTADERPLVKAQLKTARTRGTARSKRRTVRSALELAAVMHAAHDEHRAQTGATVPDAPATASNTGSTAERSEAPLSVSAAAAAEEPLAPLRVATASPAARAAAFRAKLEEESRARYQAALAQHARSASIRRPLSSVAGYAAW